MNTCEFCNSAFATAKTLRVHTATAEYCLIIQARAKSQAKPKPQVQAKWKCIYCEEYFPATCRRYVHEPKCILGLGKLVAEEIEETEKAEKRKKAQEQAKKDREQAKKMVDMAEEAIVVAQQAQDAAAAWVENAEKERQLLLDENARLKSNLQEAEVKIMAQPQTPNMVKLTIAELREENAALIEANKRLEKIKDKNARERDNFERLYKATSEELQAERLARREAEKSYRGKFGKLLEAFDEFRKEDK